MWRWLKNPANQRLLTLLGPAVAAVAVAIWTVFTYLDSSPSGTDGRPSVGADRGSVAVGGDVGGDIRVDGPAADDAVER